MALRTKRAKRLTKKQQQHLTDVDVHTLAAFKRTRAAHAELKERFGGEPCYECRFIALKLRLED